MGKKKIKIQFTDFWDVFDANDNFIMDALRKNFEVEISDEPDFVFCSIFGRHHLKYDCAKIYYTGENIIPDFNLVDYGLGFQDISFYDRYLRLPHYVLYPRACQLALEKPGKMTDEELVNREFCSCVVSNAVSCKERGIIIDKLNEYKRLASGGRYRNNVGGPVADKIDFSSKYKFCIAIENSPSRGYTTEKIMEAFAANTVPIYWGNPDIAKEFNPKSFINIHDFESFDAAVEFVKKADEDDELYLSMVKAPIISSGVEALRREQKEDASASGVKEDGAAECIAQECNAAKSGVRECDAAESCTCEKAAECLSKNYLSDFLYKVCSQDPQAAIRRNRIYQGKYYEDEAKSHERIDRVLYMPRRLARGLKNRMKR